MEASPPRRRQEVALLVNAHSRQGERLPEAAQALREAGITLGRTQATHSREEMEALLRREKRRGAPLVIVGGGDGTLSACAQALKGSDTALGVLPLGSGNTFARSLGMPVDLAGAARVLAAGRIERVDVGSVNGRSFLNSVSLGVSAAIADTLEAPAKKRFGLLAWPLASLGVLRRQAPLAFRLSTPEGVFRVRSRELVVANGRYVAGPITATPGASVQDGRLDVFTLGGARLGGLLRASLEWLRGRVVESPATLYLSCTAVRVTVAGRPAPASVDGETDLTTPLAIKVESRALAVLVPPDFVADEV